MKDWPALGTTSPWLPASFIPHLRARLGIRVRGEVVAVAVGHRSLDRAVAFWHLYDPSRRWLVGWFVRSFVRPFVRKKSELEVFLLPDRMGSVRNGQTETLF